MSTLSFEDLAKLLQESLRRTYGEFLVFEENLDEIFASEKRHGFPLVSINFTSKTAVLLSAAEDVQALLWLLEGQGFNVKQSHDGVKRLL